jgi:hypothetical protein
MQRKQECPDMFVSPSTYIVMSSAISCIKKIGYNDELGDKIILCCDGRNSWRKEIEKEYKGNREEQRNKATFINWEEQFEMHNKLLEKIEDNLPFFTIKLEHVEADDLIAEAVRFWKDNQCVIVSPDEDFLQLLTYDNVSVYSPHPKVKLHPFKILSLDRDKEKELAYKSIMKKVEIEKTDNLCSPVLNEEDYDKRLQCVSLLDLPKEIKDKIKPELEKINVTGREYFYPEAFSPGIAKRLPSIFGTENIITYDDCRAKMERKSKKDKKTTIKPKKSKKTKEVSEPIDRDEVQDDTQTDLYGDR